jgi:hypothetical protein
VQGVKFCNYIKKHKLPVLRFNIARDQRALAGFEGRERATTNISESYHSKLKREIHVDGRTLFTRLIEYLLEHLTTQTIEFYLGYDMKGEKVLKKNISEMRRITMKELILKHTSDDIKQQIDRYYWMSEYSHMVPTLKIERVAVLCKLPEHEAEQYEDQAKRLIAMGLVEVTTMPSATKKAATVYSCNKDKYYMVTSADITWNKMYCTCPVSLFA